MAHKDLRSAKILFEYDADNEIVCFHCQQAVEKYLKGYLIYQTGRLNDGHSLIKLCKIASKYEASFKNHLKDMAFLNDFYIETRYPAEEPLSVSRDETLECFKIVDLIINKIDKMVE